MARPLRGRICPSQPGGMASARPVGTRARSPGRSGSSAGPAARRSSPALPGEAGVGSGRSPAPGSRRTWIFMPGSIRHFGLRLGRRRAGGAGRAERPRGREPVLGAAAEAAHGPADPADRERGSLGGAGDGETAALAAAAVQKVDGETPLVVLVVTVPDEDRLLLAAGVDPGDRADAVPLLVD